MGLPGWPAVPVPVRFLVQQGPAPFTLVLGVFTCYPADHVRATLRFPPPWTVEVIDRGGTSLAYVYARDDLARHTNGLAWLTTDEARRIATAIARLPALLARPRSDGASN